MYVHKKQSIPNRTAVFSEGRETDDVIINEAYYVLKINGLCLGSINPVSLEVNL
jgi:hypothetical protein